jgi:hypothetical protein
MKAAHSQKLLQWAKRDNEMVYIKEVENGIKCRCKCEKCGEQLIARNLGRKNTSHFSHVSGSECVGSVESAIHRAIKELFLKTKTILLPPCFGNGPKGLKKYISEQIITFDVVEIECRVQLHDSVIIPDAVGYIKDKKIFIEFAYTHFIEERKFDVVKNHKIPCIEVDLRLTSQQPESLINILIQDIDSKKWIFNPKILALIETDRKAQAIKQQQKKLKEEEQKLLLQKKAEEWQKEAEKRRVEIINELLIHGSFYKSCPIKEEIRKGFLYSLYGRVPIIKKLLNEVNWNGKIYGEEGEEIHIFIGRSKHIIVPATYLQLTTPEKFKYYDALDAVVRYRDLLNALKNRPCTFCKNYIDMVEGKIYCKHKEGRSTKHIYKYQEVRAFL